MWALLWTRLHVVPFCGAIVVVHQIGWLLPCAKLKDRFVSCTTQLAGSARTPSRPLLPWREQENKPAFAEILARRTPSLRRQTGLHVHESRDGSQ